MTEYIVDIPEKPAKIVKDGWNVRIEWQYKQREEVVRCRDCVHFEPTAKNGICHRSEFLPMWAESNGFCAWGERLEK